MKRWLLRILVGFALISVGWHVFEFAWDRTLFSSGEEIMEIVNVSAKEAAQLIEDRDDLQVVDVRPEASFFSGHLPGAVRVSYGGGELDRESAARLDRDRPLLVYCDGGFRSRLSLSSFEAEGFKTIYHLHRGILSWKMHRFPCDSGVEEAGEDGNQTQL